MEDILKRLMNGESADAIAKEFTDALNNAMQEMEAQKEAELQKTQKLMDTQNLIDVVIDYVKKYYPEVVADIKEFDLSAEELIEALDTSLPKIVELNNAVVELDKLLTPVVKKPAADAEDSILRFLKLNGLL